MLYTKRKDKAYLGELVVVENAVLKNKQSLAYFKYMTIYS